MLGVAFDEGLDEGATRSQHMGDSDRGVVSTFCPRLEDQQRRRQEGAVLLGGGRRVGHAGAFL